MGIELRKRARTVGEKVVVAVRERVVVRIRRAILGFCLNVKQSLRACFYRKYLH